MFPLVAVLASFGLVMVYRISSTDARQQAQWFVLGLILFAATIIVFRDYRKLERYRYIIVAISLVLLVLPRLPGIGYAANGAYLGVRVPGLFVFQPPEFAKIGLVIFLASYLRDTRQLLVVGARRVLGVTIPPLKHFGPVVVIWGLAMAIARRALTTSAPRSCSTGRCWRCCTWQPTGCRSWSSGWSPPRSGSGTSERTSRTSTRASRPGCIRFNPVLYNAPLGSFQIANSLFAQAAGGLFGQGFGQAVLTMPGGATLLPFPQTDMIYAVITDELGLFGATAVILDLSDLRLARVQGRDAGA